MCGCGGDICQQENSVKSPKAFLNIFQSAPIGVFAQLILGPGPYILHPSVHWVRLEPLARLLKPACIGGV